MKRCLCGECGLTFSVARPPRTGTVTLHTPRHGEYEMEGSREGGGPRRF